MGLSLSLVGWGVSLHNLISFLRAICAPVRFSQTIQLHSIASALFLSFGMSCDVQLLTVARSPFFFIPIIFYYMLTHQL